MEKLEWTKIVGAILGIVLLTLQTTNTQRMTRVETSTMPASTIETHIESLDTRMMTLESNVMDKDTITAHITDIDRIQTSHENELENLRKFVMDKQLIDIHLSNIEKDFSLVKDRVNKLEVSKNENSITNN